MKLKFLLTFAIIVVVFVSFAAYLPVEIEPMPSPTNNEPDDSEDLQPVASQTAPPSPSPSPSIKPNNTVGSVIISGGSDDARSFMFTMDEFDETLFDEGPPPGPVGSAETINSTMWRSVAQNAWSYFQPGVGVDPTTGLPGAGLGHPFFTDWDLGVYIQAVLDAQRIGLIGIDGDWGANTRIEKIMNFLENRDLADGDLPFWWYESETGRKWDYGTWMGNTSINVADTGRLLVALHNLKKYDNSLSDRINWVVYERMNYSLMWRNITSIADTANVYNYLVAKGFASFWPANFSHVPSAILDNIFSASKVESFGVRLPLSKITCEPLLISIFDLENDSRIMKLSELVYSAHEARYNETGRYTAFSEGNTGLTRFVYEWVVLPNGRTWVVQNTDGSDFNINPIVYYKVAFGFLALYKTEYARNMLIYLENSVEITKYGYNDGIDDTPENGRLVPEIGSNNNGLILSAARYAIVNEP